MLDSMKAKLTARLDAAKKQRDEAIASGRRAQEAVEQSRIIVAATNGAIATLESLLKEVDQAGPVNRLTNNGEVHLTNTVEG